MRSILLCLAFLLLLLTDSWSQRPTSPTQPSDSTTYVKKKRNIFKGEPGKAALFSLIIPGGGQVYNKDYWKVPLVYAAEGAAIYYTIYNNDRFNRWNTCYESILNDNTDAATCGTVTSSDTAFRIRNGFRSRRELSYVFVGLAHLLNIVEAYVDRHLTLFDISDDLSILNVPELQSFDNQITLVRFSIPLN